MSSKLFDCLRGHTDVKYEARFYVSGARRCPWALEGYVNGVKGGSKGGLIVRYLMIHVPSLATQGDESGTATMDKVIIFVIKLQSELGYNYMGKLNQNGLALLRFDLQPVLQSVHTQRLQIDLGAHHSYWLLFKSHSSPQDFFFSLLLVHLCLSFLPPVLSLLSVLGFTLKLAKKCFIQ